MLVRGLGLRAEGGEEAMVRERDVRQEEVWWVEEREMEAPELV